MRAGVARDDHLPQHQEVDHSLFGRKDAMRLAGSYGLLRAEYLLRAAYHETEEEQVEGAAPQQAASGICTQNRNR